MECQAHVDGVRLEHVSEFKYLGCVLDEAGTELAECSRKVVSKRRVAGAIRSLVNAADLQSECARAMHETLLVPVFMCGSETMIWRERERSREKAVQVDNLRGLLGIRRMDRVPSPWKNELCGVAKGKDERVDEGVLQWFGFVEKMEKDRMLRESMRRVCWWSFIG